MRGDGGEWFFIGPLFAVALVGFLGAILWRLGLHWTRAESATLRDFYDGLAIFRDYGDDYGLLCPAAMTDDPELADDLRGLLAEAGIRATTATRPDGRILVLVFPETAEEARRLVGGSPAL
jgi:hypothetical protein